MINKCLSPNWRWKLNRHMLLTFALTPFYRPERSCEGYVFTGICLSTGGWGCLPQCMLGYHTPPGADPLGTDTPLEQTAPEQTPPPPGADPDPPPGSRHPPLGADTPWEQTLPSWEQTPPRSRLPHQDTATAADGTHPTGMHSCFNHKLNKINLSWLIS